MSKKLKLIPKKKPKCFGHYSKYEHIHGHCYKYAEQGSISKDKEGSIYYNSPQVIWECPYYNDTDALSGGIRGSCSQAEFKARLQKVKQLYHNDDYGSQLYIELENGSIYEVKATLSPNINVKATIELGRRIIKGSKAQQNHIIVNIPGSGTQND